MPDPSLVRRSLASAFSLSFACAALAVGAASAQSLNSTQFPNLPSPIGVALGDFNGDGRCDSATIHQAPGTNPSVMNLMLGDGAGLLLPPTAFPTLTPGGAGIVAGDWNGDSKLDVATVELNSPGPSGRVSIFLGNGAGGFQTVVEYPVGIQSRGVAAADFNGDGVLDLATANSSASASSVTILLGDGLGGFTFLNETPMGSKPWSITAGDLNADGIPDVATANNGNNTIGVLLNDGTGNFPVAAATYPTGAGPRGITVGDLNGDGQFDVVTANGSSNNVTVYFSAGSAPLFAVGDFVVGTNPSSVTIGDVDGDGFADICATDQTGTVSNVISVLLGTGAPSYGPPNNFPTGNFPASSRIADLNSDGRADLVVVNYGGASVTVLMNTASPAPGFVNYGHGTQGCFGELGIALPFSPNIGNPSFRINATNTPRQSLGLILVCDAPDIAGSDPFGLGATFFVDFFTSTAIIGLDAHSDVSGVATFGAPLPNDPFLVGAQYFAQALFVETPGERCSASQFALVTSTAMSITVLP